jgi:hypothetical protein
MPYLYASYVGTEHRSATLKYFVLCCIHFLSETTVKHAFPGIFFSLQSIYITAVLSEMF